MASCGQFVSSHFYYIPTYQVLAEKKLFEIYSPRIPREAVTICHPGHSCMVYGKREELVSVGFFEEEEERILRVVTLT